MKIFVCGTGAWATALAIKAAKRNEVTIYCHSEKSYDMFIKTGKSNKLPDITLDKSIKFTKNINDAKSSDMVVIAFPSFAINDLAVKLGNVLTGQVIVLATKGLDENNDYKPYSYILEKETGSVVVGFTGPTHAEEVSKDLPSVILAASDHSESSKLVQDAFMDENFRVYTGDDPIGAELGGAFKNIIAIAAGISDGIGYGDNAKAALMTRGIAEIKRLGTILGAKDSTFLGISGIGDLIVTCTSKHSRNNRAGFYIGSGMDINSAMDKVGAVVEGYYATKSAYFLAEKLQVEMPIVTAMYEILYNKADVTLVVNSLLTREKKGEH